MLKPRIYRTSSSVKINNNADLNIGQGTILTKVDNIEAQAHEATGYVMLLKVAKKLSLVSDTISEDILTKDDKILATLTTIRSKITTSVSPLTNTITFIISSKNPEDSKKIANTLAFVFKEFSFDKRKLQGTRTESFLRSQCRIYEQAIDSIEKIITDLQINTRNIYPDNIIKSALDDYTRVIEAIKNTELKISTITFQRSQLLNRYYKRSNSATMKDIKSITDSLMISNSIDWISGVIEGDRGLANLNDRLFSLQLELSNNLIHYTTLHPKIITIEKNIQKTISEINKRLTSAVEEQKEKQLKLVLEKKEIEQKMKKFPSNKIEFIRLTRELDTKRETYSLLYDKLQYAMIEQAGLIEDVTLNQLATLPEKPFNTDFGKTMAFGLYFGIMVGIITGILKDIVDPSIKNVDNMRLMFKPLLLAVIPRMSLEGKQYSLKFQPRVYSLEYYQSTLFVHFNPTHTITESYKVLRENLKLMYPSAASQVILISSAAHREGRSTTIANLAIAYAQSGKKVCLLECDFRNPSIEILFGINQPEPGLSDIILGTVNWKQCMQSITDIMVGTFSVDQVLSQPGLENLYIVPRGIKMYNPSMLLDSRNMSSLFDELKRSFDIILVDAPPLLPVADSLILCKYIDGVILVYRAGKTAKNLLERCIQRLEAINVKIYGIVMNDIDIHPTDEQLKSIFKKPSDIVL